MSEIGRKFEKLRNNKTEKALVGFVTAGDPDLEFSLEIVLTLARAGVDIIELGVPFSDPTADGPVIQRASMRSLRSGTTLRDVIQLARSVKKQTNIPLVLFSYYNPLFRFGAGKLYESLVDAGVDGILVVDLPPEEAHEFLVQWSGNEIDFIRLIAPTTPPERIEAIVRDASGFIYLISKTGVTGSKGLDYDEISSMVQSVKVYTNLPVCVGFGISEPEQVRKISAIADGIVIGSAFVRTIEKFGKSDELLEQLEKQVKAYKQAQHR
ncbi:MAG: tryptophan synthase subunit alpha [Deltaproteobacteria bacterium]|nr:tryptophan synthase subunit alpha [Deltaproteobacteria bacterium]MBW2068483.1 tryptophan synthase subunit alpha [Deltaproteobacteria bacterium]